jgi:hypothetical protein
MIRLSRPPCPNPSALRTNYRHPDNKQALRAASFDKCMYCESKLSAIYFGDVEHFRPKDRFPELEFSWGNLGFVCARCNNAKRNKWHDAAPYIDPYEEDPGQHLAAVGTMVLHRGGSERGEVTWRDVELNRSDLLERRAERIAAINTLVDKVNRTADPDLKSVLQSELEREVDDHAPYSLVAKAALAALR